MRSEIIAGMVCITAAIIGVRYIEKMEPGAAAGNEPSSLAAASRAEPKSSEYSPYKGGWNYEVRVPAGYDRQFRITAAVNRNPTGFLIDTGAAFVALRESDARRAGIYPKPDDFTSPVSTANGITNAARVTVDEIEIDSLLVKNVDTFILPDEQLGMNLLGMSFLSQLKSVEARGEEMILRG